MSYGEWLEERKKHSLKTVSAAQLEEAISKALSELLDYPHEVKIEHIEYAESLRGSQLRLAVNQGYKEEKREGSEPDESKVSPKRESSLSGLELQWQEEAELVQWFEIAKNKGIAVASQRDRFSRQLLIYLKDERVMTFAEAKKLYPIESLLDS